MKRNLWIAGLAAVLGYAPNARSDVKLHPLFSDGMVLQRQKTVPVWGTARPGEKVTVKIAGQQKTTVTAENGTWRVELAPLKVAVEQTLVVNGDNEISLKNVAVGDVFLCAGQSNMESWMANISGTKDAIAAANFPDIRCFTVPHRPEPTVQSTFAEPVSWQICSPEIVAKFSATAYFFGRELHQKLGIPIGLINASWGNTNISGWMNREALSSMGGETKRVLEQLDVDLAFDALHPGGEYLAAWWEVNDIGSRGASGQPDFNNKDWKMLTNDTWSKTDFNDRDWKLMKLPQLWEKAGLPDFDGVVWFRKTVKIPAAWAGHDVTIHLGKIADRDTTYVNGISMGADHNRNNSRHYRLSGQNVKAGAMTIAVRVLNLVGDGGFNGGDAMRIERDDVPKGADNVVSPDAVISLEDDWKYCESTPKGKFVNSPESPRDHPQWKYGWLFNGMIAPLRPFAMRGVAWYQGENDAGSRNHEFYRKAMPAIIRGWRQQWGARQDGSEFGFFVVQLPNYETRSEQPQTGEWGWTLLREAQSLALKEPRTAVITTIDSPDSSLHPSNKQDVGKRLALAALAIEYGLPVEYSGPVFKRMEPVAGTNKLRLHFTHSKGLKTSDGQEIRGFSIGNQWAKAHIEDGTVVVWRDDVSNPTAVRYAWAENPPVNLVNEAGLPTVPFRTDAPVK